ncbi:TBC1 domain family member 17 [Cucumis melo var. makuwa]|uniref:TBC1 domain family member 17 n=1 Tax=Cucumis melo var. makuwa TaxID=1194695 RepID=A0A5A7SQ27_CUCMM|nr:TBC1 domain family member 17 [Cucumis melo var. makuwa]
MRRDKPHMKNKEYSRGLGFPDAGKGSEKRETFVAVRSSLPSIPSSLPSVAAVRRCDCNFSFSLPPVKPIGGGFPDAVHGVGKVDEAFPTSWFASGKTASEEAFPTARTASGDPFSTYFSLPPTIEYATRKEDCQQMFTVVESGRYITAPVISEDDQPIHDPLVLLEINPDKGPTVPQDTGPTDGNLDGSRSTPNNNLETAKDPKIIQWMLTLHQIELEIDLECWSNDFEMILDPRITRGNANF